MIAMLWLEVFAESGFVNLDHVVRIDVVDAGDATWRTVASLTTGASVSLRGVYASQAEAQQAARQLVHGIDPTTITGG